MMDQAPNKEDCVS